MDAPRLTEGAVKEMAELPNGPGRTKPVLQVVDVRAVAAKGAAAPSVSSAAGRQSERYRMLLSDGVHSVQSMLATALNHHVRDGSLCPGSIVHLQDIMCNTIKDRKIIIVVGLDVLQSECAMIGKPKIYDAKRLPEGQEPNLPPNAAQTNTQTYSGGPGMVGTSVAPRTEHVANNVSYDGSYNGVQGTVGTSTGRTVEPGSYNVLSGGSYGTMSAQNTMNVNTVQPKPQQPLLNSHQNSAVPATVVGGYVSPGNPYERPAQPSYQQPPPAYVNRGPVSRNEAASRVVPISALNPYQGRWTIKARVTAKSNVRHYNSARSSGKLFNFDLLDADGGEIRATGFNETVDKFFDLIEVDKVYLISRGSLRPAKKEYNPLNNDYEINLDTTSSIEVCSGDDSSIPRQQFNFRQISEVESMQKNATVDLLGVVTSISPSVTIMKKDGTETQKRTLQLRDMSGCSVEITFWGNFCDTEGQQLQGLCDSGMDPILALKNGRVGDFNGRSVGTISSSMLKINPDFPDSERLRQWYNTEGKAAACTSLSQMSNVGRADVRKTITQIKEENLGRSEKADWITIKGSISLVPAASFCYPACTLKFNDKQCAKKVTNNGDGMWRCDRCDNSSETVEYRYLLNVQILDHTGATYATAFQEGGEQIFGMTAQELFSIRNDEQDVARFTDIIQGACWHLYLLKLRIKEETFSDEARVKCSIVKAEKLDSTKENNHVLRAINSLLQDDLGSTSGARQSAPTSNNAYGVNMGGTNQFGHQASIPGGMSNMDMQQPPAGNASSGLCFKCNQPGHFSRDCPGLASSYGDSSAGGNTSSGLCFKCNQPGHFSRDCPGFASSYGGSSAGGNTSSGLCFKCNQPGHFSRDCPEQQAGSYSSSAGGGGIASSGVCYKCNEPGHFARDCPAQATAPQRQTYGSSGGYNRQSYVGGF